MLTAAEPPRPAVGEIGPGEPAAATASAFSVPTPYPLSYTVDRPQQWSRVAVLLRPLLVLPHLLFVSVLALVAALCVVVSWFRILLMGSDGPFLWRVIAFYLRRRAALLTFASLLSDRFPPFTDRPGATHVTIYFTADRSRWSTLFRGLLAAPQFATIALLSFAWLTGVVIAWPCILATGHYPEGIRRFVAGVNRWLLRVEGYALLLYDEYPPYSLGLEDE